MTSVSSEAFRDCPELAVIKFPSTLTNVGNLAFVGTKIYDTASNWADDVLYIDSWLIQARSSELAGAYAVKDGTKGIADYAFYSCSMVTSVIIPVTVTTVSDGAFNNCEKLKGVSVPPETTQIGANAIVGCPQVTVSCKDGSDAAVVFARYRSDTLKGDVDSDGELTIVDSTSIQRYLAYMIPFNGMQAACSDIDYDAEVSVTDATLIQMILAKMIAYP